MPEPDPQSAKFDQRYQSVNEQTSEHYSLSPAPVAAASPHLPRQAWRQRWSSITLDKALPSAGLSSVCPDIP